MSSKTEEYLVLAQRTANGLTRYWESWTDMVYHFPLFAVSKHFSTFFQKRLGKDLFLW